MKICQTSKSREINNSNNDNNNNNNNNDNNNNEISSSNKNSTIKKDNVISPSPSQISKETVFILGDSMVKKLNGFYWQGNSNINALSRYDHLVQQKSDACMIMWSRLYEMLIRTILSFIAGLMIWTLSEQLVRLPDLL